MSKRCPSNSLGITNVTIWKKLCVVETLLRAVLKEREPILNRRPVAIEDIIKDADYERVERELKRERKQGA